MSHTKRKPAPTPAKVSFVKMHLGVIAPEADFHPGTPEEGGAPVPKPVDLTPRIQAAKTRLQTFKVQHDETNGTEWAPVKAQYDAADTLLAAAQPAEPELARAEQALD